jgi:predicted ABC-class ATPase
MGDHVLTRDIDDELTTLIDRLEELERHRVASILTEARRELAASWGKLANRSTRTKQAT